MPDQPQPLLECAVCALPASLICPWCCDPVCGGCSGASIHKSGACDEGCEAHYVRSPSAVYCITPTSEETARRAGALSRPAPVSRWELEPPKRDPWADPLPDDDDDDGEDMP